MEIAIIIIVIAVAVVFVLNNKKERAASEDKNNSGVSEVLPDMMEVSAKDVNKGIDIPENADQDEDASEDSPEENCFFAPEAQILVVDDEEESRQHIEKILARIGVQYESVNGGIQCIERVKEKEFHIILISHKMVRMDGVQTLRNIKKTEGNLSIGAAIYALTPAKVEIARDVYMKEGFDGCLSKPVGAYALEYMLMEQLPAEVVTFSGNVKEQMRKASEAEEELREYDIMLAEGVENSQNNVEAFRNVATSFCDDYDGLQNALVNLMYDGKCSEYSARMKMLAESAHSVGANVLEQIALEHIEYANLGDMQTIDNNWREFTLEWEKCIKGLSQWLGMEDTFTNVTEILSIKTNGIELPDQELGNRLKAVLDDINSKKIPDAKKKLNDLREYELADEVRMFVDITYISLQIKDVEKARNMIQKIM